MQAYICRILPAIEATALGQYMEKILGQEERGEKQTTKQNLGPNFSMVLHFYSFKPVRTILLYIHFLLL